MAETSKPKLPLSYPIKYLTYAEMQQRRDHDLCLICDEKHTSAHRCQTQRIIFVLPNDDSYLMPQPPLSVENMTHAGLVMEKKLESKKVIQLNHCSQLDGPMMGNVTSKSSLFMPNKADVAQNRADDVFQLDGLKPAMHLADFVVVISGNYCPEMSKEQDWSNAHNMFVEMNKLKLIWADEPNMFAEMNKLRCESKVPVFDPGGTFNMRAFSTLRTRSFSRRR